MRAEFDDLELGDLQEAVRDHLKELFVELAHADQRAYQKLLRDKCERFEKLAVKLDAAGGRPVTSP